MLFGDFAGTDPFKSLVSRSDEELEKQRVSMDWGPQVVHCYKKDLAAQSTGGPSRRASQPCQPRSLEVPGTALDVAGNGLWWS